MQCPFDLEGIYKLEEKIEILDYSKKFVVIQHFSVKISIKGVGVHCTLHCHIKFSVGRFLL